MFSIGMRLQTCLAQNGSFSWSGWGGRGRTKGGKGQDYWPSCCIGHLGLQSIAWNEGLMYGHTVLSPRVCCFSVGSCCNTTLPVHVVCPLERTQSGPTGDSHTWFCLGFCHIWAPKISHISLCSNFSLFPTYLSVKLSSNIQATSLKLGVLQSDLGFGGSFLVQFLKCFFFLLAVVAVHWRATSAYTWSDVDHVLVTTPCFCLLSCRS